MNHDYQEALARGRARWGDRFVAPAGVDHLTPYFRAGRVEVTSRYRSGELFVRRGVIGITTGWQPALLLVHRRGDSGSWDTLNADDRVTAWIDGRGRRVPVKAT